MFDNQPTGQGIQEVPKTEDIFSGLDQGGPVIAPTQPQAQFSVEDLGQPANQTATPAASEEGVASKRLMVVGGIVVGLLILAIGVWFALLSFKGKAPTETAEQPNQNTQKNNPPAVIDKTTQAENSPLEPSANKVVVPVIESATSTENALLGETAKEVAPAATEAAIPEAVKKAATTVADTDSDGLTDEEEAQLGTYPDRSDTDGDDLNDFAEIKTYFSNPKNPDTDGDGFKDGDEVRNGYNPNGAGKLIK